jgi:acetophenone carboxylase
VDPKNVIGIDGMHDAAILGAVRALLESGVRRICISLQGAFQDPEPEARLKRIIDEQYPDHYLGSVPVLTGSDVCPNSDDSTRTYNAVINAYIHSALAATLFKAEDELRYTQGYARAFLVSHINGGVAGVSKTRALDTLESGPVLGIYGAACLAKVYGLNKVLALDVGGTTAKLGVIHGGEPLYIRQSDLFGIPVRVTLPYLRSIALGGGSVVSLDGNQLRLGPESMGSFPGPACYGLGGDKATLTDAFVAAGLCARRFGGTIVRRNHRRRFQPGGGHDCQSEPRTGAGFVRSCALCLWGEWRFVRLRRGAARRNSERPPLRSRPRVQRVWILGFRYRSRVRTLLPLAAA